MSRGDDVAGDEGRKLPGSYVYIYIYTYFFFIYSAGGFSTLSGTNSSAAGGHFFSVYFLNYRVKTGITVSFFPPVNEHVLHCA